MKNIRVLHVLHSHSWGGLELYTVELIKKLASTGHTQYVLCFANSRVAKELSTENIVVIPTSKAKISKFAEARFIRKAIAKHSITHLHSHSRVDMWACAMARWFNPDIKHIYNLYMNAVPKKDFVHRELFKRVDALCSSSETILNDVRVNFPITPEKLRLIRYGRETELFKHDPQVRASVREALHVQAPELVVGTLCRIDAGKGVRELVDSLEFLTDEELQKIQLWVIGAPTATGHDAAGNTTYEEDSWNLFTWLQDKIKTPRLHKHLVHIPFQKEYIRYIDALDIFTLASYNETYSLSVLDAMMMGKPVIGTNAGGTPEQTGKNERGLLADPRSAKSLAECIRTYLKNPDLIQTQGTKAQEWALANHNWPSTLNQFLKLYQEL
ncbi:MAG: glycosyltransferase family 4 protein [Bdellovibrio sp.]